MSVRAIPPSVRHRMLAIHIEGLRRWTAARAAGPATDPAEIRVGPRAVSVEAWEAAQIALFADKGEAAPDTARFAALSFALLAKCMADLERLGALTDNAIKEVYALQAELMLDNAVGRGLLNELQDAINVQVGAGAVDGARQLSRLHHKLRRVVGEVRVSLAASEQQRATGLAERLGVSEPDPAVDGREAAARLLEIKRKRELAGSLKTATHRRVMAPATALSTSAVLGVAVAIVFGVWLVLFGIPERARAPRTTSGSPAIGSIRGVTTVADRHPSLFVTVDRNVWSASSAGERAELLDELWRGPAGRGYRGVFVVDDAGRPVARWLAERGAELIDATPPGPATAPATASTATFPRSD